jgi:hypothetical protein
MNSVVERLELEPRQAEVDLTGVSVCIAIPCYSGTLPIETALALVQTSVKLKEMGIQFDIVSERENGLVTSVRNRLLYRYLTESDSKYLFWLDDDIIFTVDDFIQILAIATKKKMAAASYPTRTDVPVFFIKYINDKTPEFDSDFGLIKSQGVGMGFICMERDIVQEVFDAYEDQEYIDEELKPRDIFKVGVINKKYWGEDMSFLTELYQKFNHITYVHPWINLKHVGRKDYNAKLMDSLILGDK